MTLPTGREPSLPTPDDTRNSPALGGERSEWLYAAKLVDKTERRHIRVYLHYNDPSRAFEESHHLRTFAPFVLPYGVRQTLSIPETRWRYIFCANYEIRGEYQQSDRLHYEFAPVTFIFEFYGSAAIFDAEKKIAGAFECTCDRWEAELMEDRNFLLLNPYRHFLNNTPDAP